MNSRARVRAFDGKMRTINATFAKVISRSITINHPRQPAIVPTASGLERASCRSRFRAPRQRRSSMTDRTPLMTHATGSPVVDNTNIQTAGPRGPALLQDIWLIEKLAHFDREVIPERRMHAKGWGAHGTFTVTKDITRYTKAKIFSEVGKQTSMLARFSTVAGERGAADAERDIRGTAHKFYTEEG